MVSQNLTGVWQGLFTYPSVLRAGNFSATLIETSSHVSGSTSEVLGYGLRKGETVLAFLSGKRDGFSVVFAKQYEGPEKPNHSVKYEGTLTGDFMELEGRWFIPGNWAGRFLMIRSGGRSVEMARATFERA
ncbi:MAG TPA: hypothetical protein VGM26_07510 [Rhizomicrobium sp.]|jgi:hypothetical protein